jgi:hypothetical protein
MIDHAHIIFRESSSELGEGRMIGNGIVKRKTQKLYQGDSVVDLGFQFRIGIDLKPLLKNKAFHENKRRIGIVSFEALANWVVSQKQAFNAGPIDSVVAKTVSRGGSYNDVLISAGNFTVFLFAARHLCSPRLQSLGYTLSRIGDHFYLIYLIYYPLLMLTVLPLYIYFVASRSNAFIFLACWVLFVTSMFLLTKMWFGGSHGKREIFQGSI